MLFVPASGFTLIFGLMRIVNPAHGAYYLPGGNVAISTSLATGSCLVAIVVAVAVTGAVGLISERLLLRPSPTAGS